MFWMKIENEIMHLTHVEKVPINYCTLCHTYTRLVFLHMSVFCSSSAIYSLEEAPKKYQRVPACEIQNQPQALSLEFKFHESHDLEIEKVY